MTVPEFGFKIEVEKVDHQKNKDDQGRVDHELGKERCLGRIANLISNGPGDPVQQLEQEPVDDMQQDPAKQNHFKHLDQDVICHKVGSNIKYSRVIEYYEGEVNAEMDQQECDQE